LFDKIGEADSFLGILLVEWEGTNIHERIVSAIGEYKDAQNEEEKETYVPTFKSLKQVYRDINNSMKDKHYPRMQRIQ